MLEQRFDGMCTKDDLKNQLKSKASNERFIELRENLHKLQVMSVSTSDKYEQEMKKIDITIGKKNSELQSMIQDLQIRTKTLEDEINEENDGDMYNSTSREHIKSKILQTKNSLVFESEVVN